MERDRQDPEDQVLTLLGAAQGALGLQLFLAHADVLVQQALSVLGLAAGLQRLQMQVDQNLDLGTQDEWVHRFEDHIDSAGRVGLEEMRLVAEYGSQEDDRYARVAPPGPDEGGGLIAVHARHLQIQQHDGGGVLKSPPKSPVA